MISDLTQFAKVNKTTNKKSKSMVSKEEQTLRSNIGRVLSGYEKDAKNAVVDVILSSKTNTEINNKLVKLTGSTKTAGQIYQKIKEYI